MGTLSGLAIPNDISQPVANNAQLTYPAFTLDNAAEQSIKEFVLGMHLLQHYIERTNIDMDTIASDNLRLLHNNLKHHTNYKYLLNQSSLNSATSLNWHWAPIIGNDAITAGLLFIGKNTSIYPEQYRNKTNVFSNTPHSPFAPHEENDGSYRLFLSISGNLTIKNAKRVNSFHKRSRDEVPTTSKRNDSVVAKLKSGETFVEKRVDKSVKKQSHSPISCLKTGKEPCTLLCVYLSTP